MAKIIDKEEKRCDIALSAITLFCEKGIQQTSIDQIAKSAGVAKGTIYLYFKNKEELIFEVIDRKSEIFFINAEIRINKAQTFFEKLLALFCLS